ncbi:DUF4148 domain-containing protein [Ramlibacter sp. MMS24-I3-19]|uniref:DUF4148 domain-containing protein n=1 Tax=Ramlibacter sp. MMS24-I3-19 TaxID=3416606 RepID=UPI003D023E80
MQVRSLIATAFAVATLAAGGTAFAQTTPYGQEGGQADAYAPAKTRAQVQDELVQFRAEYPVSPWSFRYDPLTKFKSQATRADVTAAYIADRDAVAAFTGEDSGSAYLAQNSGRGVPANANLASNGNAAQVR